VLRLAKAIESGYAHEELVDAAEKWIKQTRILVSIKTLKYFIRGGRVSRTRGFFARLLNLKPIISVDEKGRSVLFDKSFSRRGSINKVLRLIRETAQRDKIWEFSVIYSNQEEKKFAEWYSRKIADIVGKEPVFIDSISPVVGASAGIGTVAVSFILD
jgi:DegV family protein with EDD domain